MNQSAVNGRTRHLAPAKAFHGPFHVYHRMQKDPLHFAISRAKGVSLALLRAERSARFPHSPIHLLCIQSLFKGNNRDNNSVP